MNVDKKQTNKNWYKTTLLLTFMALMSYFLLKKVDGNDFWWHTKIGEYIFQNKTIPLIDVFSWYGAENSLYWISHEWLSEVIFYLIESIGGFWLVYILTFSCIALLLIILYIFNKKYMDKHKLFVFVWLTLGILLITITFSPRPHIFSYILLAITMYILYDIKNNEQSKKIWFLPLVSCLWANIHGGSSNLPYIIAIVFIIGGCFNFTFSRFTGKKLTKLQLKKISISSILSIVALFINPHGFKMITYPYVNMGDSLMLSLINEWRCPDIKLSSDIYIFVLIAVILCIFFVSNLKIDLTDFILSGAFIYLTFKSIRFVVLLYIVSSFIVFKYINKIDIKEKYINYSHLFILGITMIFSLSVFNIFLIDGSPITRTMSDEAIAVVKDFNPKRVYNDYNTGGDLIYNEIPVFIDARADLYSSNILRDFASIIYMTGYDSEKYANFEEFIDSFNFDLFVTIPGRAVNEYFDLNPEKYTLLFEDDTCIIYEPNN